MTTLTAERKETLTYKEQFERDGCVIVRNLLTRAETDKLRDAFMAAAANGPVEGLSDASRLGPDEPLARYPRIMHPHNHRDMEIGQLAWNVLFDERVHIILKDLIGDEPLGCQTMFYFKPPGARGQDLHQDNFYLRVKPGTCVAAWIAVDDADETNGGMVVVPGSHKMDIVCPEKSDPTIFFTTEHVPTPEGLHEQPVTLKAGDCLFFDGSVIHGSYPNTSDRFRRALISHYLPESSVELAHYYQALRFDGTPVTISGATGGGPCGTPWAGGVAE